MKYTKDGKLPGEHRVLIPILDENDPFVKKQGVTVTTTASTSPNTVSTPTTSTKTQSTSLSSNPTLSTISSITTTTTSGRHHYFTIGPGDTQTVEFMKINQVDGECDNWKGPCPDNEAEKNGKFGIVSIVIGVLFLMV